jgi:hypothetical protein
LGEMIVAGPRSIQKTGFAHQVSGCTHSRRLSRRLACAPYRYGSPPVLPACPPLLVPTGRPLAPCAISILVVFHQPNSVPCRTTRETQALASRSAARGARARCETDGARRGSLGETHKRRTSNERRGKSRRRRARRATGRRAGGGRCCCRGERRENEAQGAERGRHEERADGLFAILNTN